MPRRPRPVSRKPPPRVNEQPSVPTVKPQLKPQTQSRPKLSRPPPPEETSEEESSEEDEFEQGSSGSGSDVDGEDEDLDVDADVPRIVQWVDDEDEASSEEEEEENEEMTDEDEDVHPTNLVSFSITPSCDKR